MGGKAFINTYKGVSGHWILYGDRLVYANTWYHVVGVFDRDGDKGYVYVDGVKEGEASMTTDPYSNDAVTKIGCRSSTSDYAFNGLIDDVMVFDRTLSGDEIQTLFNFGNLSYDAAGNLTQDQRGYDYEYDYENRIVKITKDGNDIAEFAYDALGRRVEKKDLIDPNNTRRYYHNYKWQVLTEYNGSGVFKQWYAYGNYIDEVLMMGTTASPASARFYIHDHLYSPAVLTNWTGSILERYEYDAYGNPTIWNADFTAERESSNYANPYLFTGRRVDILDSGSLKIQYNRNRYYDYYTGRWLTHDPLGITPNPQKPNEFGIIGQYKDWLSLYEYVSSKPVMASDPLGLIEEKCNICGPDITGPINSFATFIKSKFTGASPSLRTKLCRCIWGFGMCGGNGWDTVLVNYFFYPNCALPDCEHTVEINSKCYSRKAVNYYQWGLMHKLCKHSVGTMMTGMLWTLTPWSGDFFAKLTWARAGFHGHDPTSLPAPSRYHKCDVKCCKVKWTGELGFKWKGTDFIISFPTPAPFPDGVPITVPGLDELGTIED